jgi:hypothetical protein
MRLPSAPISSFHELGMMRKLDQSSQKRRELRLAYNDYTTIDWLHDLVCPHTIIF